MPSKSVLFVCTGNICRSPTAAAVLRHLLQGTELEGGVRVDSAGTHDYQIGAPADQRACEAAARRGFDMSGHVARQVEPADFARFDLVVAMDHHNYRHLVRMCPPEQLDKIHLLSEFAPELGVTEVPDPYEGGEAGFEHVLDLVEAAARRIRDDLQGRATP